MVVPGARLSRISVQGGDCSSVGRFSGWVSMDCCVCREVLMLSQQSRTEQLQEALRQKVRSEDSWRDKVTLGALLWGAQESWE